MRFRLVILLAAIVGALAASALVGVGVAQACDANFWNIGCQFYSPSEGHSASEFCCSTSEGVYSTFDTYSTVLAITTTSGGSWVDSYPICYGCSIEWYPASSKVGCYNNHSGTMYVNCRHYQP
jgi:hypothetical protein